MALGPPDDNNSDDSDAHPVQAVEVFFSDETVGSFDAYDNNSHIKVVLSVFESINYFFHLLVVLLLIPLEWSGTNRRGFVSLAGSFIFE